MDVIREDLAIARKRRRMAIGTVVIVFVAFAAYGLSRLEPAAPVVERGTVWLGTVERGPMVRQVRGTGTLVPETIQWISAASEGQVERIHVQPGTAVEPDTVILELTDRQLTQTAAESQWRLKAVAAEFESLRGRLESQRLEQEAVVARTAAEAAQARLRADADAQLAREGLLGDLPRRLSQGTADELRNRVEFETQRLAAIRSSISAQLAAQSANVEQARTLATLQQEREESLQVRAGIAGVLQQVAVEIGQRVSPGATLAKVVRPDHLKAELRVAETQARDIQLGQSAVIDTRNGTVRGEVARIDPAADGGTVTVDISLAGPLPRGARPDLTVDGTIELERLDDVLHVKRPIHASDHATIGLFRLNPEGTATRVPVKIGRTSVNTVEILDGLQAGDQVILSDTSSWDDSDRIRLK